MAKERNENLIRLRPETFVDKSYTTTVDSTGLASLTITSTNTMEVSKVFFTKSMELKAGDTIELFFRGKSGTSTVVPGYCDCVLRGTTIISNSMLRYNTKYLYTLSKDLTAEALFFWRRAGSMSTVPYSTEYYVEIYVNGNQKVGR